MPPDRLGVATVTADDALRWSDAIAAHTSSMRLRILHGDGMLPRADGSSVILYPGVDTMVHFWPSGVPDIPFTAPRRSALPVGTPILGPALLWVRFLPIRDVLRLSALNMTCRDALPLILSERDHLHTAWHLGADAWLDACAAEESEMLASEQELTRSFRGSRLAQRRH